MKTAREEAVQSVGDSGHHKRPQRPNKPLIKKQRDKDWDQRHPEDGQHVWQGDNPRGHETISDFEFAIADWAKCAPESVKPFAKQSSLSWRDLPLPMDESRARYARQRSASTDTSGGQP
jgi:hypothetical protein